MAALSKVVIGWFSRARHSISLRILIPGAQAWLAGVWWPHQLSSPEPGQFLPESEQDRQNGWRYFLAKLVVPQNMFCRSGVHRGRLYCAWMDQTPAGTTDILLSLSDDHGQTWSAPAPVTDRLSFPVDRFLPWLAVDLVTGDVNSVQILEGPLSGRPTTRSHNTAVTAEQVGLLDHYFQLARFLQPAMIVIEDVDLIARSRETMYGPCDESILNKLLNEMDGLREDAAILFILTTNRPDSLEAALASRPGRIDQAIEPLPDENGRRLLLRLYACGLPLDENIVETIVRRTDKASAAFIKELMRRTAQFYIQNGTNGHLQVADVNAAMEEMLFAGGSLNAKLLGATEVSSTSVQ
jgi:hypothetical protein